MSRKTKQNKSKYITSDEEDVKKYIVIIQFEVERRKKRIFLIKFTKIVKSRIARVGYMVKGVKQSHNKQMLQTGTNKI